MNTKLLAIFLFSWLSLITSSYSQDTNPLISIKNDSAAILTESLTVDIKIAGNIATTTLAITFYNPADRVLEGEFNFPLAEGQKVFRFAMDVDGKLREGVMVDKEKGRRAFEHVVRQTIDPGLLEMTAGNNYKARVYPIPASGRKSIVIGYEEELVTTQETIYNLAMKYGNVQHFRLNVEVLNQTVEPRLIENGLINFKFEKWLSTYKAGHEAKNFCACMPISFALPIENNERIFVSPFSADSSYFYITCSPVVTATDKILPKSVVVFWDVSQSAAPRDVQKELDLLDRYFKNFINLKVRLISFSNSVVIDKTFRVTDGNWSSLKKELHQTVFDGGTNPGILDFKKIIADEALLFTDGIFNLSKGPEERPAYPVYTINSNISADHDWLRNLSEKSGGVYINLLSKSSEEAYTMLSKNVFQFIGTDYAKSVTQVFPNKSQPVSGTFSAAGIMKGAQAGITLLFGTGKKVSLRKTITIDKKTNLVSSSESISRIWATKKITSLSLQPEINREEIIRTATRYNIITPFTSLIILDRVEDYVRYEITPPAELLEAYNDLIRQRKETATLEADEIVELALEEYSDRQAWWEQNTRDSKVDPHVPIGDAASIQQQQQQQQPQNQEPAVIPVQNPPAQPIENIQDDSDTAVTLPQSRSFSLEQSPHNRVVTGKITDETGEPLPGVNILIKGTTIGTVTDAEGNYQLGIPDEGGVLMINYIGYKAAEIQANNSQAVYDVQMNADIQHLSEVVVVGYSEQRRSYISYAVSEVVVEELHGSVADVSIENVNGPVAIRGNNSQHLGQHPMYIVDGVLASEGEMQKIAASDIGNVNVIKPENAIALYGSRASDGVVVIMTRSALEDELLLPDSITEKFETGMVIKAWNPETPYLDSLRAVPKHLRYNAYIQIKALYENTPSFFLITGNFFLEEGDREHGLRILSNIAEMELENHELLKVLAYRFTQLGETAAAITLLEKTIALRGNEPQSWRDLALACEKHGDYQKALDNFLKVIFMDVNDNDWDDRFPLIKNIVIDEMNHLISKYKKHLDLSRVPEDLILPMPVDLRIVLDWNALETDIDLWVTEPNGEQCNYKNGLTMIGGCLSEDFTDGYGPEAYLLKKAVPGTYRISVDFYDERQQKISGPVTLQVTIFKYYGSAREKKQQFTVQLSDKEENALQVAEIVF